MKVNEKVIALSDNPEKMSQKRVKGVIYTIEAVRHCPNCGLVCINIGGIAPDQSNGLICNCLHVLDHFGLGWTSVDHFASLDQTDKALESALEQEDYEFATILRDLKI